jgi:hypothetical protein
MGELGLAWGGGGVGRIYIYIYINKGEERREKREERRERREKREERIDFHRPPMHVCNQFGGLPQAACKNPHTRCYYRCMFIRFVQGAQLC